MRSILGWILLALAAVGLVVQLALPRFVAGRVEDRLERDGGSADVEVKAFPALTLLAGRGGSLEATGRDLRFRPDQRSRNPFERLDGFERVEMSLTDVDAGLFRMRRFDLVRRGRGEEYELRVRAVTTARDLAAQLGTAAGGPIGGLLGSLAGGLAPGRGDTKIPLELSATVASDDGRAAVTAASGVVAGLPAGPLARTVLAIVLDRL